MSNFPPNPAADLAHIRLLLDRNTRFLSLSGLSGVASGLVALAGITTAFVYLQTQELLGQQWPYPLRLAIRQPQHLMVLGAVALLTLALALMLAWHFSARLAKRRGDTSSWNTSSRRMASQLFVPVGVGAVVCLMLTYHSLVTLVLPVSMVFYGLGLYAASRFTLREIRTLGLIECALGCIGLALPSLGLLLWAVGFGLLHIAYGLYMYQRYERIHTPA